MHHQILETNFFKKTLRAKVTRTGLGEIYFKNFDPKACHAYPIIFEGQKIGILETDMPEQKAKDTTHRLAALLLGATNQERLDYACLLLKWVDEASRLVPDVADWIGLYFKESWWLSSSSKDLIIGPYFGEVTEHVRISIDRGICGMALREERVVNVQDVRENPEHIACSLKTRSELVLPLQNKQGEFVAELDIDSNKLNAFTPEIEKAFRDFAATFPQI
ncbi:MAG: hypothetical protein OHK0056_29830 [Bacteriovoracaceae bacterium]